MKKNTFKKILRIAGISLGTIVLILLIFIFSLRFGFMQNFLKDKAITYLEEKIKTPVALEKIYIGFPNSIALKHLYLKGQKVDTLLYAGSLEVKLDMWALMNSKADITSIALQDMNAHVVRNEDGSFNFDYIIDAFASEEKEEKKEQKPFVLSLDKIDLKGIKVAFTDLQAKNNLKIHLHHFNTRVQKFDLENNAYAIGDILLDGLKLHLKQDMVQEVAEKVEKKVDSLNQKKPMQLALRRIQLKNFDIGFDDENSKTFAKVAFQELSTKVNRLDLTDNKFDIQYLKLNKADIDARLFLTQNNDTNKAEAPNKTP